MPSWPTGSVRLLKPRPHVTERDSAGDVAARLLTRPVSLGEATAAAGGVPAEPGLYAWWGPAWCDTPMHCVNYVFRQGCEHKYAYDEETLARVLEGVGFASVSRRSFNPSTDAPNHAVGSLCMVARKTQLKAMVA